MADSTTVLKWIQSESCIKFVGTRIAELQDLTEPASVKYVPSALIPADDITRGKELLELSSPGQWRDGPPFLRQTPEHWPVQHIVSKFFEDNSENLCSVPMLLLMPHSLILQHVTPGLI